MFPQGQLYCTSCPIVNANCGKLMENLLKVQGVIGIMDKNRNSFLID
jgi:hypothetical protein